VTYLKSALVEHHIPFLDNQSHIIAILVKDAAKCYAMSQALLEDYSIYAQPINYPTVPVGKERLRLTPTPWHRCEDIDYLVHSLEEVFHRYAPSALLSANSQSQ
jgi:5-aminolevulinate synthase